MDTIFIESIPVIARHGLTGREKLDPQRYDISIALEVDTRKSGTTDLLSDTYDYKKAYAIVERLGAKSSHNLIETVAHQIGEQLCRDSKVYQATVTIRKIAAFADAIAGITVTHKRAPASQSFGLKKINVTKILEEIRAKGGASVPILEDWYREELFAEAQNYAYVPQPVVVGGGKVREELSTIKAFNSDSLFFQLRDDFGCVFGKSLEGSASPFSEVPQFNEMSLQKYEKGSLGITPHMDNSYCKNVICLFVVAGHGRLAICENRAGENPYYLDTTPGNVIFLRAPGFDGSDFRPFHFLSDITEERIVFGLRQNIRL